MVNDHEPQFTTIVAIYKSHHQQQAYATQVAFMISYSLAIKYYYIHKAKILLIILY